MFCTIHMFPNLRGIWKLCTKFGRLILRKFFNLLQPDVTFKAKMHQIQFRLKLCPKPHSYSAPRTYMDLRRLLLKERVGVAG